MVQGEDRRCLGLVGQAVGQPAQPHGVEPPAGLAGDRRVEREHSHAAEIEHILDRLGTAARQIEADAHRSAVVVVAGQDEQRTIELRDGGAEGRVLLGSTVVGEITGVDDRVGRLGQRGDRVEHEMQGVERIAPLPVGAEMGIGDLRHA